MRSNLQARQWGCTVTVLILLLFLGSPASNAQVSNAPVPLHNAVESNAFSLQTTRAIRSLSPAEAARGYPVHLRATVVYYDASIDLEIATLFVHDATGGIFVMVPARPVLPLREGTVVEVSGVSGAGDFAPIVSHPKVRVVGQSSMPKEAPLVSLKELMDGNYDSQWVQVEGVVHSIVPQGENMVMRIATGTGMISATTVREPDADYARLIDAKVRAYTVAASRFNKRRQLAGVHLFFSMRDLTVLRYGPSDPFGLPVRPISRLSEFTSGKEIADRVHLRGRVTLQRPGQLLCVQDATGGLCLETLDKTRFQLGTVVDVVGFRAIQDVTPKLTDGVFRAAGEPLQSPSSLLISSAQALGGNHSGELVQLEGEIAGLNSDPREPAVLIASGDLVFSAVLPAGTTISDYPRWQNGSKVRVLGICTVITNAQEADQRRGEEDYVGFRILMRSPEDLTILRGPSWWTPLHTILALSVALVTTLGALGWAIFLHRRVRQQTGMIQESERQYRHLAYHDPLTGLPNRALLQLRLSAAIEQTALTKRCLALLMLDLDGFKQINDNLGHDVGDAVLRIVADRIGSIVGDPDTVARMGGDEFVVVLLGLRNVTEACSCAERIQQSLSAPLQIGPDMGSLSCSIGISVLQANIDTAHALLKTADDAMYQAKMNGRNQFRLWESPSGERKGGREAEAESADEVGVLEGALG